MALIELHDVSKVFPNGVKALDGVSLQVQRGEFLAVIGLSGSGKSTLLRCINRLTEPTTGRVLFDGQDVTHLQGRELRRFRQRIGMIFQQFNVVERRTVLENVLVGALGRVSVWRSLVGSFSQELIEEALHNLEVVGLADKAYDRVRMLSGGQKQRVAIARALMQRPQALLADEPVASLDPATSHSVMRYLEEVNQRFGVTVVCSLHFLSLVRRYAHRVVALRAGRIVFEGAPTEITDEWFRHIYGEEAQEVEIR
ncbi:MAG: phosphonate ABC transporter ATP-binding protein [Candidatus Kapabacteria bacterium]|nr:phosphonate ABC transporter ATP-binding protein [Candidatus Kapabacteria bacterium]MDW8012591.1 phosphonate ABC transporter ATP-binding protein [Bacteroidota bacterium]